MAEEKKETILQPKAQKEPQSSSNKRIAKNSLMLYIRMFITLIVGLYTSRVVLATLGVVDYGIYGVVGGIVAMIEYLKVSTSAATSRFISFELGRGDIFRLKETFSSSLIVLMFIAIIVFVLSETIGLWFLCNKLDIPNDRMNAAHWVYQCSIISAMLSITQTPYNATIIAHEKMGIYAFVEILNVTLKLIIVYLLVIWQFDKLKLYAVLVLIVSICIRLFCRVYCIHNFKETHFHWVWKKNLLKPLLSFSGWDMFGNLSTIARTQGVNMLVNMFFGAVANAAIGVSTIVQGVLMQFSTNISTAVRPQVIKSYSVGDFERMSSLIFFAAKYLYLLLLLLSVPVIIETKYILHLWLNSVPEYSVWFVRYMVLFNFFALVSLIAAMGIHATGKMKRISLINGSLYLSVIPFTYFSYRYNGSIYLPFIFNVIAVFLGSLSNIYTLSLTVKEISLKIFFDKVLLPVFVISFISFIVSYEINQHYEECFFRLILVTIASTLTILILAYIFAEKSIKKQIKQKIHFGKIS